MEAVLQLKHQVAHEAVKNIKIVNMFTHGCPFDSSVISLHTLHYWHWTLIRDNSLIQLQPRTGRAPPHLPPTDVGAVPNKFEAGVFSRASNEPSRRLHNHREDPY